MKPVVSAAQIAAQAYAQSTVQPKPRGPGVAQPRFNVDAQKINGDTNADTAGSFRRIRRETEAFKIEISAAALAASEREAGQRRARVERDETVEQTEEAAALVTFQAVDGVSGVAGGVGRREVPFAHEGRSVEPEPVRRPGSLLDITI